MMAGTRWRIPGTAWSRTQQYNVSIVMIHRFSVSVGPCMYSRYEFIAEELSLIDTYMYTCNKWSQLDQAHILIHICSIFSVLRNILKFKLLLSFFFNYSTFTKLRHIVYSNWLDMRATYNLLAPRTQILPKVEGRGRCFCLSNKSYSPPIL